ncbi:hypothetical protein JCM14469_20790 [Desulfatiferula olefinivorans]
MARIDTRLDKDNDLKIHHVHGPVDGDDIIDAIRRDLDGLRTSKVIWDFSDADMERFNIEKMRQVLAVGKVLAEARQSGKTAIVVPQDLSFGMGRMYETMTEIESFATTNRSFRSLDAAKDWLGIPPERS